jgi:hypothetical protein
MLAWNGVISWWVLLASFAFWVLLLAYGLLRHAIPHQLRHERVPPDDLSGALRLP